MRKRPLLLWAFFSVTAVLFAQYEKGYLCVTAVLLFLYAQAPLAKKRKWGGFCLRAVCLVLVFLAFWGHTKVQVRRQQDVRTQTEALDEVILQGKIAKKERKEGGEHREDFVFYELKHCFIISQDRKIACRRAAIYLTADEYSIGETLFADGKLCRFSGARNEGSFDLDGYYAAQQIDFYLWNPKVVQQSGSACALAEFLYRMRCRIADVYADAIGEKYGGILAAMLLGEKSKFKEEMKQLYQKSGIAHLCALSGLHMSIIGLSVYRFFRKRRWRYTSSFAAACTVLVLYVQMTGQSVSARRSVIMLVLYMLAEVSGQKYDMLNGLGLAVLLLLWENPFLLQYAGMQFSVISILGIGTALPKPSAEPAGEEYPQQRARPSLKKALEKAMDGLMSGIGIGLFTLPLTAYYYYEIPLYAAFLNFLVLPFLGVLFGFGIAGGLFGLISAGKIHLFLLMPCKFILWLYETLAGLSCRMPFAQVVTGCPSAAKIIVYYLFLLLLVFWWRHAGNNRAMRLFGSACLVAFLVFARPRTGFEIDFLDVGQGDGIYLHTESGAAVFIDGGSLDVANIGRERILPFLKYKGEAEIDYWVVTHADLDHTSGLEELLAAGYPVRHLVVADAAVDADMQKLVQKAALSGCEIVRIGRGSRMVFGEEELVCLSPQKGEEKVDKNDLSLVLYYRSANLCGILTGDISGEVEKELVKAGVCGKVDFYKAAHHGSKNANTWAFLQELRPDVAVVSCSRTNRYGHPAQEAVAHMERSGAAMYYTMNQGQIKIAGNPKNGYFCTGYVK